MTPKDRLIVALDRSSAREIESLAAALRDEAGAFKIGLQAFVANGPELVRRLTTEGFRIFLDLKFHDIPNTARYAVAEAAGLGASMLTLHAAGGIEMMRACADAAASTPRPPLLLGVTALTSLDQEDLRRTGNPLSVQDYVRRLARAAREAGLGGVVASPQEIELIRSECGPEFSIVTPGIRSSADAAGDQKRTLSAADAIRAGADWIVVGRPVTASPDPTEAARRIIREIS
ncbi:MAG: orotidine-5'-phosphate decarboxylase [Thermoanaerobaculia bacterium]